MVSSTAAAEKELQGMVLRCDQTGKLFFSHREAEVHGEETGFQAFSQVSLEEKVWVCEETGKLCFNEQQMDLHKRRVPEAKTFNEKTIADVKAEQDAKVSAGDGEMETEEDIIRREAGLKGGKKGAAAEPAGPPVITKESVDQLLDMGFTQLRAEKALVSTSNGNIEAAINWLTAHLEDADIDEPHKEDLAPQLKTQDEISEIAAKKLAGSGSQLTDEEKKAKMAEALTKARAKKAGITVEEEKEKERLRREGGKGMVLAKRDLDEAQKQRDIEARKREKREFELERQKLREKLAQDKRERMIAKGLDPDAPPPAAAPAAAPAPAAVPKGEKESEAAAAAAAAAAGFKRSYAWQPLSLEEATEKICALSDTKASPGLAMLRRMIENIAKNPAEAKYRKVRLSNPKVAEGLVHVPGVRQWMGANGWQLVEDEFITLPEAADAAAQLIAIEALVQAFASSKEAARAAELEARKKETADRLAAQKRERDAIKAAMARDRGEVAARGPAEASVAKKLPSGPGGMATSAKFQEEADAEDRRNAR